MTPARGTDSSPIALAAIASALALACACGPGGSRNEPPDGSAVTAPAPEDMFKDTSSPDEVYKRALALYSMGRYTQAAAAFQQASRMRPGFVGAHYHAGASLLKSAPTDFAAAERELRKVMELSPDHVEAHVTLAQACLRNGEYEKARLLLEKARSLRPRDKEILHASGRAAAGLGLHAEALGHLQAALALDPAFLPALLELGLALGHLGKDQEALQVWEKALALQPDSLRALHGAGMSLSRLGRQEESRRMLDRFREAQAAAEGREMEAKRLDVRLRHVEESYAAGRREEARRAAGLLLEEFPRQSAPHASLAAIQSKMGDEPAAIATYEKLLAFEPDNIPANFRLVELYTRAGEPEKARARKAHHDALVRARAGRK